MKTIKLIAVFGIVLISGTRIEAQSYPTNGLLAYYPLDGNAGDASGNGYNGITNAPTPAADRFGNPNGTLTFHGSDIITVPGTETLNFRPGGFSLTAWIRLGANNQDQIVVGKHITGAGNGYFLGVQFNRPNFYLGDAIGNQRVFGPEFQVNGAWHSIVGVFDGQSQLLYVDGALAGSQAGHYDITNSTSLSIGAAHGAGGAAAAFFAGSIDDVRIYSRALSSNEVLQLFLYESQTRCNPHPAIATAQVVNGFVVGATITDAGCGYTTTPLVLIQGGGGSGATATAVVSNGVVVNIIITSAGIGYTSAPAILIGSAPVITGQPQSLTVNVGDNALFNVAATGDPQPAYQWSFNGASISGATASTLTISNVAQAQLGSYAVSVSNAFGNANSTPAVLSMYPYLAVPFRGAVTYWGKEATLAVQAGGSGPLSYQWFQNGSPVLNATNAILSFSSIQFTNAGLYWVVVSSPFGSVTNAAAQVVVNPAGVSLGLYPGVKIDGVVGYRYVIQRTADLSNTNSWVTMTNLTLTEPVQLWVDTNLDASLPSNPYHFYQVLPGQ